MIYICRGEHRGTVGKTNICQGGKGIILGERVGGEEVLGMGGRDCKKGELEK